MKTLAVARRTGVTSRFTQGSDKAKIEQQKQHMFELQSKIAEQDMHFVHADIDLVGTKAELAAKCAALPLGARKR